MHCIVKIVIVPIVFLGLFHPMRAAHNEPTSLLPDSSELGMWRTIRPLRLVVGDELFSMIDGGADVYLEYGFRQAAAATYADGGGKSVSIELYQMSDDSAAYGMFSLVANPQGDRVNIGDGSVYSEYYCIFWKDSYLVFLTGSDTAATTRDELLRFAHVIEKKITGHGKVPTLVLHLPQDSLQSTTYIRGFIGLSSRYDFDLRNIFNVTEGVVGSYPRYRMFIFNYETADSASRSFAGAMNILKTNGRFENFSETGGRCIMTDRKGNELCMRVDDRRIVALVGRSIEHHCGTGKRTGQ